MIEGIERKQEQNVLQSGARDLSFDLPLFLMTLGRTYLEKQVNECKEYPAAILKQ